MEQTKVNSSQIKLENILLIKSNFNRDLVIDVQDRAKLNQEIDINISTSDIKQNKFAVYLNVDFLINYESKSIVQINLIYSASFDKTDTVIDEKALNNFIDINAPAIIFPFIREEIATHTTKAGIGGILIQPVNFIELSKNKKNSNTPD